VTAGTAAEPDPPELRERSTELRLRDGLRLRLREQGSGAALLLLHGFTGSSRAWGAPVRAALAARGRVLAVDLIGHGESDRPLLAERYGVHEMTADLCELLDARGCRSAAWIGYSMGARIALAASVLAPARVAALVLEGGSPGLEAAAQRRARAAADAELAARIEREGIAAFVDHWMKLPLFASQQRLPAATLAAERERRLANDPLALAGCLRGLGTGTQPSFWRALASIRTPVLLIAGEHDVKYREIAVAMARALPDAACAEIRDAGHATHLERPDGYLSAVLPFLERIAQSEIAQSEV
jgi:2-succinyl-6-hydroxy-2,4-cyclohexadiene-1-carboxylate synthase